MAHGGKRTGAGRKIGALTLRTRETAERAIREGVTPLDVMLGNMRHFQSLAESADRVLSEFSADKLAGMEPEEQFKHLLAEVKKAASLREMAHACARDAAAYVHPKLATVQHSGPNDGPIPVRFVVENALANEG